MSRICGRNTTPERTVRSVLHRMGYRFSLRNAALPGKPDIVLRKHNTVVFVNGCFWHQHSKCADGKVPKSRRRYWVPKLRNNAARDRRNHQILKRMGWRVLVVWECQARRLQPLTNLLKKRFETATRRTQRKSRRLQQPPTFRARPLK